MAPDITERAWKRQHSTSFV